MRNTAVVFTMLVVAGVSVADAQALPSYRHRLLGVYDAEGRPLAGVQVADVTTGTTALTSSTGTVSLAYVADGGGEVRIRQVGFVAVTQFVRIGPSDTTPVTVILRRIETVLPAIVSRDSSPRSPGLRGFEERRRAGRGYFLTERELRRSDNREMQHVLRTIPGVSVSCVKTFPQACHAVSGRVQTKYAIAGGACLFALYVDGVQSMETDLGMFQVRDYAGIESYSGSQIPSQYNKSGNACGVLLFWTRER